MKACYMDNCATTAPDPQVLEAMAYFQQQNFSNASSLYRMGLEAARAIEGARHVLAKSIGASAEEIFFTSGATEANNWAVLGIFDGQSMPHFISTSIEHPSVKAPLLHLRHTGKAQVSFLSVNREGYINLEELEQSFHSNTVLVSVIHGNHEVGSIQNLSAIGEICHKHGVPLHVDASQSYLKVPIDVRQANISLMSLNSHKIHGPKGIGALFKRKGLHLRPLLFGGQQEQGLRPGTYATPLIVGMAKAVELGQKFAYSQLEKMRLDFLRALQQRFPQAILNGPQYYRLPHNLNICFPGVNAQDLLQSLSKKGVYLSTGSVCTSGSTKPSAILTALGLPAELALSSLRIGLSRWTTPEELVYTLDMLEEAMEQIRRPLSVQRHSHP